MDDAGILPSLSLENTLATTGTTKRYSVAKIS
jgi:hypothetical protein